MMRFTIPILLVACTSHGATSAQRSRADTSSTSGSAAVDILTAANLARAADALARGGNTGQTLLAHEQLKYVESRRVTSGTPEIHDRFTDVTFVQSGRAALLAGGHVNGSRVESDGEHRGGVILGGTSRPVGAGDFIMIPAGVPHQYVIAAGDSLRYLTVKVLTDSRVPTDRGHTP